MLALAFWVGSAAFFTLVATPAVFGGLPREEASRAVGAMFPAYFLAGGITGVVVLLLATLRFQPGYGARLPILQWVVAAVALVLILYGGMVLLPKMQALQAQLPNLNSGAMTPERLAFRRLHGFSMGLNLLTFLLSLLLFLLNLPENPRRALNSLSEGGRS